MKKRLKETMPDEYQAQMQASIARKNKAKQALDPTVHSNTIPGQPQINPEIAVGDQHLKNLQAQRDQQLNSVPTKPKSPMAARPVQLPQTPIPTDIVEKLRALYSKVPKQEFIRITGDHSMSPETKLAQIEKLASMRDPNMFGEGKKRLTEMFGADQKEALMQVMQLLQKNPELIQSAGQMIQSLSNKGTPVNTMSTMKTSIGGIGENKKFLMTKTKLVEAIKDGILVHEKKRFIKETLIKEIKVQVKNKVLIENYLNEGPLSNVFSKLKAGTGNLVSKLKNPMAFDPSSAMQTQEEQNKVVTTRLTKLAAEAQKMKQKFTQEVLKNAELIHLYHQAIVNLYGTWRSFKDTLIGQKMSNDVFQLVGGLHDDLQSEKDQLDTFLSNLDKSTKGMSTETGESMKALRTQRAEKEGEETARAGHGSTIHPDKLKSAGQLPGGSDVGGFEKSFNLPDEENEPLDLKNKKSKAKLPPRQKNQPKFDPSKITSAKQIPAGVHLSPQDLKVVMKNIENNILNQVRSENKPRKRRSYSQD